MEARSTSTRCRESLGLTIGQIDAYLRMQRAIENGVMVGGEDEQDQVEQDQVEQGLNEQEEDQEQNEEEQNEEEQNEEVGQDQFDQEQNENEEEQVDQVDQEHNENDQEQVGQDQFDQEQNEDDQEQVEIRNMVEQVLDILVDEDEQRKRPAEEDVTVGVAKRIKLEANQEPVKPVIMNEVPIEIDSDEEDDGISEDEDGGAGEGEGTTSEELMEAKRVYEELLMRSQKNNPKIELKREKMGLGEREEEVDAIRREREGKQASLAIYRQRMLKLTSPPVPIPVLEVPVVPLKPFFQSFLFNFHSYFSIFRLIMGPPKEPKHWLMGWHPRYIQHFSLNFVTLISYFQADNVPVGPLV